ncbi:CPBP family glutamic-type intramembrane protease [Novosphingobium sp. Leaf2]|uniref:CPBP family glutamic-type intramembrane protease n=1 Tax=Novosphingobium sp. Leaf2 TaxID=1735670 RepID=UPI0007011D36|nr:CPBP family glutamic-type intramembrane protease [Novosphingobium sp. Leaf2]KQM21354.1 CAAX protease [Novosphingobium sp. Leaf2]
MTPETAPLAAGDAATLAPSPRVVLREWLGFLRRPAVLTPSGLRTRAAWRALCVLLLVHLAGMLLVILPVIALWQRQFALPMPDAFGKLPDGWLLPITILIAPVLEEMIFRGWQRGRPRALWLLACFAALVILLAKAGDLAPKGAAGALAALIVLALGGWLWLRKRPTRMLYRHAYPATFWLVALTFAGFHLMNYPATTWLSLPMVLPQLWAALLLGFTRQRLGLPAAMLQHAAANAASMALAAAGG